MRVCGVYFVFVILLSACTNRVSHLDIALQQAKHNKAELENCLLYTSAVNDSRLCSGNSILFPLPWEAGSVTKPNIIRSLPISYSTSDLRFKIQKQFKLFMIRQFLLLKKSAKHSRLFIRTRRLILQ